jgi:hypothetical protein
MAKTKVLEHTGYEVTGVALLNLWGGGQGRIRMTPTIIPIGSLTKENLLGCINDGQFGCESIASATLMVYDCYGSTHKEHLKTICVDYAPHLLNAFRGIKVKP